MPNGSYSLAEAIPIRAMLPLACPRPGDMGSTE
jgi:hypothetical protein